MLAGEVAENCVQETGAARISSRAKEVALIAIACAQPDRAAWKKAIRRHYREAHPECGSVFLIIVLPILVSLISQWLGKWLFKESPEVMDLLQAEARSAFGWSPK